MVIYYALFRQSFIECLFSNQVTKESLDKAISICAPGVEINRIGRTIQ
jgi:hypothetical protein